MLYVYFWQGKVPALFWGDRLTSRAVWEYHVVSGGSPWERFPFTVCTHVLPRIRPHMGLTPSSRLTLNLLLESISHLALFASNPPTENQTAVQGISRLGKWGNRPPRMRPRLPRCHDFSICLCYYDWHPHVFLLVLKPTVGRKSAWLMPLHTHWEVGQTGWEANWSPGLTG